MYKNELQKLLNQSSLANYMLLYGVCEYQITYYGEKITKIWDNNNENISIFYHDDYDFESIKRYLSENSLFGDKNIAVIKTNKVISKKDLDKFVAICKKNTNCYLLVQCYEDDAKIKTMTSSFGKNFVRFFKANINEAINFLNEQAKMLHVNIQGYALSHLFHIHNEDLSLSINELNKLSILQKEIKKEDIDMLVFGLGEVDMEEFINNLLEKKDIKSQFLSISENSQFDEVKVINSVQNYITQLFLFHSYIKLNGKCDVQKILGYALPLHVANQKASLSLKIQTKAYVEILQLLASKEYELKSSTNHEKTTLLLSTLLGIQRLLN